ncbi:MAG: hypothetical protein AAGL89_08895 [Pseudomonadota bacterium]
MKKTILFLSLYALAACADYQEPQANCFSFVSRGPAAHDCNFDALDGPDLLDLEDIANE